MQLLTLLSFQLFSRFGSSAGTTVEQLMQMGVFTLQFYKDCLWHVVTVDSFLPCKASAVLSVLWRLHMTLRRMHRSSSLRAVTPTFSGQASWRKRAPSCSPSSMCVHKSMLRYAKLHGSYSILQGGSVADALVDLTGAVTSTALRRVPRALSLSQVVWL
jgi:hypothetical protein